MFSILLTKQPVPNLRLLSVIGISKVFSGEWLDDVAARCPKLQTVYFTRRPGTKALGWNDVVMMQTMREPVLCPCGHIGEKSVLAQMATKKCPLCRQLFRMASCLALHPRATRLQKEGFSPPADRSNAWTADIVDAQLMPLTDRTLYHIKCGVFYNPASVKVCPSHPRLSST